MSMSVQSPAANNSRVFDFSRHSARKVAFRVAYCGWNYHGLAYQLDLNALHTPSSIESELFNALTTARLVPPSDHPSVFPGRMFGWSRCGRTDKGVSAFDQVCACYVRSNRPVGVDGTIAWDAVTSLPPNTRENRTHVPLPESTHAEMEIPYLTILNRLLPPEIRVTAWSAVPHTFDARFDCTYRLYKYFFPCDKLDIQSMRVAARSLVGTHDFRWFCKIDPAKTNETYIRTIHDADVVPLDDADSGDDHTDPLRFFVFVVKGNAFLWHQVRCMIAVLFLVGSGLEPPNVVTRMLSDRPLLQQKPSYDLASEIPLVLAECGYAPGCGLRWESPQQDAAKWVAGMVWHLWRESATKTVQLKTMMEGLVGEGTLEGMLGSGRTHSYAQLGGGAARAPVSKKYVRMLEREKAEARGGGSRKRKGEKTEKADLMAVGSNVEESAKRVKNE